MTDKTGRNARPVLFCAPGQERGEFWLAEPESEAEHITIYIEGLKTASSAIPFSAEMLTRQFEFQLSKIGILMQSK